jgi:hypothetical protein
MAEKSDPEQQHPQPDRPPPLNREIVSTTSILHNFPRNKVSSFAEATQTVSPFEKSDDTDILNSLERLRKHKANENRLFGFGAPNLDSLDSLTSLFQYYFPCRGKLPVQIFDFGPGRAERLDITLGDVEQGK